MTSVRVTDVEPSNHFSPCRPRLRRDFGLVRLIGRDRTMPMRSREMTIIRRALLAVGLFSMGAKAAMAGQTQIVLQWIDTEQGGMGLREISKIEEALETVSRGEYFVDGHDAGSGTVNVFLYAEDSRADSAMARKLQAQVEPADHRHRGPLGLRVACPFISRTCLYQI
jgi:hypothetical protein